MAKHISQKTFDDVVRENMKEFDMEVGEALEDAIKQFESQGVNLGNIVKDASLYVGGTLNGQPMEHPVIGSLKKLSKLLEGGKADNADVCACLKAFESECDIDLSRRCLAGTNGAYPVLFRACEKYRSEPAMLQRCVSALCALCNGQPDVLDIRGTVLFTQLLDEYRNDVETLETTVKLIRLLCIKHENNRQGFVTEKLITKLVSLIEEFKAAGSLVKEICFALRVLTFDDDIRVPFGKGHEHAKMIVAEGNALRTILNICNDYTHDVGVLGELFSTLSKLAVRDEFCKEVMDLGGLKLILLTLQENLKHQALCRQILNLLKALAGNDNVKVAIVANDGVNLILAAMTTHQANPGVAEAGCGLLATVALRNPEDCKKIIECNGHEVVLQAMKIHEKESGVQKQACMALRNMVARIRENSELLLELGAESLINTARMSHKDCDDEAKAALRDLGCKVELKELWTGEKGTLQQ